MPIYELDGRGAEFPADGKYFVAETAVIIGRVRLKSYATYGSACCAVTLNDRDRRASDAG
jgi:hypothetical protein